MSSTMSFGGHSPKPGANPGANPGARRSAHEDKPETTPESDSGGSTPRGNEGNPDNPRVFLADYERLKDVVKRLSDEKSAAYVEIDLLVKDNKDLKKREEDLLEHQADLSILDMEGGKSTKVPPFTGTDKDEYSADIWLTNVARLGELNNCLLYTSPSPRD